MTIKEHAVQQTKIGRSIFSKEFRNELRVMTEKNVYRSSRKVFHTKNQQVFNALKRSSQFLMGHEYLFNWIEFGCLELDKLDLAFQIEQHNPAYIIFL